MFNTLFSFIDIIFLVSLLFGECLSRFSVDFSFEYRPLKISLARIRFKRLIFNSSSLSGIESSDVDFERVNLLPIIYI